MNLRTEPFALCSLALILGFVLAGVTLVLGLAAQDFRREAWLGVPCGALVMCTAVLACCLRRAQKTA